MDAIQQVKVTETFLTKELSVTRLNDIHDHLWYAGRPMAPRPLNYQLASSRAIIAMEDIDFHLVWGPGRIFIKPLPRYLLDGDFWNKHLIWNPVAQLDIPCKKRDLYKCAYGLLCSYTALVQYESDFRIATEQHLLPATMTWEFWRNLSWKLLENSPYHTARVNKRYRFGELRVGRLNDIYRVRALTAAGGGFTDLMRGYKFEFATYGQQLEGYLTPILAASAYILLVLTAMQVGLATNRLQENHPFQAASTKGFFRKRMAFYDSLEN
ncbi:hypothetical protein G7Z17_g3960 [Cylindrodendrum hubeiense]|uniref:Uncharacterized protein n=1 Tax=Cylindrodendrum hubeiense TaxID=595255 RepID=A0A9P5H9R4_9HYPO|nr:hypothetical protein G7Z17_g3960 [Cylindrodendrum hubeiense]